MKPPICEVCGVRFPPDEGGLVSFAQRDSDRAWAARGVKGHPPWLGWFCGAHRAAAQALAHLDHGRALGQLRAGS